MVMVTLKVLTVAVAVRMATVMGKAPTVMVMALTVTALMVLLVIVPTVMVLMSLPTDCVVRPTVTMHLVCFPARPTAAHVPAANMDGDFRQTIKICAVARPFSCDVQ
jgi:hypothetical protein